MGSSSRATCTTTSTDGRSSTAACSSAGARRRHGAGCSFATRRWGHRATCSPRGQRAKRPFLPPRKSTKLFPPGQLKGARMNFGRVVAAGVAATVWDAIYGFGVYGVLLAPEFAKYPNVYRSNEAGMAFLPLMFAGIFVGMVVATMIYAKGYEGGSGVAEGARFGFLLAVFLVCVFVGVNYATLNINKKITGMLAVAGFFEWLVAGIVIGLVYKGDAGAARKRAAV